MSYEYSSIPRSDFDLLRALDILEAGYGRKFDAKKSALLFSRASGILETKNHLGATAGLAILGDRQSEHVRVMMVCGFSDDVAKAGDNCASLLKVCRDEQLADWISVGVEHGGMRNICERSGMTRPGVALTETLVAPLHAPHQPIITTDPDAGIIVRGKMNPTGKGQYIFSWQ